MSWKSNLKYLLKSPNKIFFSSTFIIFYMYIFNPSGIYLRISNIKESFLPHSKKDLEFLTDIKHNKKQVVRRTNRLMQF